MEIVLIIIQLLPVLLKIFLPLIERHFADVQAGVITGDEAREININEAKIQLAASPPVPEWLIRIGHEIAYARFTYKYGLKSKVEEWNNRIEAFFKKIGMPLPYKNRQEFMDFYTGKYGK